MRRRLAFLFVYLGAVAGAVLVGALATPADSDFAPFARAGATLVSVHWAHAYHDPFVQAGPFELLVCFFARSVGGGGHGASIVLALLGTLALLVVAHATVARCARELAAIAAAAFALFVVHDLAADGHPAELGCALLWFLAAREIRRGRVRRAGALVGLAAGFEPWGLLGATVLFLAPRVRARIVGGAVAAVVAAALFAPFALGGDFHLFELHWRTAHGLDAFVFGIGHLFTWRMRAVEAAVIVAVGAGAARGCRRVGSAVWIVPAVTATMRLLLDPVRYGYSWDTPLALLVLGLAPYAASPRLFARHLETWLRIRIEVAGRGEIAAGGLEPPTSAL